MFSELLDSLIKADEGLLLLINGAHRPGWDSFMTGVSDTRYWIPMFAAMSLSLFSQKRWYGIVTMLFITLVITLSDQVSVHGFKEVFERLRPCHDPDLRVLVHTVNGKCGGEYGFVSSHASNSFALMSFFLYSVSRHRKVWGIILSFYVILVGYSRIYLGVHFPGDVVVGAILGSGIGLSLGFLESKLMRRILKQPENG